VIIHIYLKQSPIQQKPGTFQEVKTAFLGCLSITTGHGLPQIVKPGNLFLNVLWTIFYAVAVGGCGLLVYQAVDQYCQFDVITMTKIKRDVEITLPAVTICSQNENTYAMLIECSLMKGKSRVHDFCKMNNLTLYDKDDGQLYCVQLNYGTNVTELQTATGAGSRYGFRLIVYQPDDTYPELAITDNRARVVSKELKEYVYPGLVTNFVLSKTVQTALGPPHSNCNESTDYRQVNSIEECVNEAMAECSPHWSEECVNNQSEIEAKCNQKYPVECTQVSFQSYRVDYGLYIENHTLDNYKLKIEKNFDISKDSDDEISKRMTHITIYFDKLETTVITQSPSMSMTSLIANVGGLLGKTV